MWLCAVAAPSHLKIVAIRTQLPELPQKKKRKKKERKKNPENSVAVLFGIHFLITRESGSLALNPMTCFPIDSELSYLPLMSRENVCHIAQPPDFPFFEEVLGLVSVWLLLSMARHCHCRQSWSLPFLFVTRSHEWGLNSHFRHF